MKNAKRIMAIIGIIVLVGMYVTTLVFALSDNPNSSNWLIASIVCTVVVPVMIWVVQLVYKLIKGDMEDVRKKAAGSGDDNE